MINRDLDEIYTRLFFVHFFLKSLQGLLEVPVRFMVLSSLFLVISVLCILSSGIIFGCGYAALCISVVRKYHGFLPPYGDCKVWLNIFLSLAA